MKYKLGEKDLEQIDKIVKTTKTIGTLYNRIFELEIKGEKHTEEFKKLLDYLSIALEVEDQSYKDFNLTDEKIDEWVNYI